MFKFRESQLRTLETVNCQETVNFLVVVPAPSVTGQSQKKDVSPSHSKVEIKSVKGAPCVSHCLFAPVVSNAHHVVRNPPVGGCLQKFWQVWLSLGSNPRVVSILKEGYQLLFKVRPPLVTVGNQWLIKPGQKQAPKRVFAGANLISSGRKSDSSIISGLLQLVVSGSKAQQQVETHPRSQSTELISSTTHLQNGNRRDHQTLPSTGGVGHLAGLRRHLLSYSDKSKVTEVPKIPSQQSNLSVHCPSFWPGNSSVRVHKGRQGSQVDGTGTGYSNPPVPR